MQEALSSPTGSDCLAKVLSTRGLVRQESGRLTQSGVIIACLVARTASAIVKNRLGADMAKRFQNAAEDLCNLQVIAKAEVPHFVDSEAAHDEEEQKCVRLWDSYLNASWGSLGASDVVPAGSQEVIP